MVLIPGHQCMAIAWPHPCLHPVMHALRACTQATSVQEPNTKRKSFRGIKECLCFAQVAPISCAENRVKKKPSSPASLDAHLTISHFPCCLPSCRQGGSLSRWSLPHRLMAVSALVDLPAGRPLCTCDADVGTGRHTAADPGVPATGGGHTHRIQQVGGGEGGLSVQRL